MERRCSNCNSTTASRFTSFGSKLKSCKNKPTVYEGLTILTANHEQSGRLTSGQLCKTCCDALTSFYTHHSNMVERRGQFLARMDPESQLLESLSVGQGQVKLEVEEQEVDDALQKVEVEMDAPEAEPKPTPLHVQMRQALDSHYPRISLQRTLAKFCRAEMRRLTSSGADIGIFSNNLQPQPTTTSTFNTATALADLHAEAAEQIRLKMPIVYAVLNGFMGPVGFKSWTVTQDMLTILSMIAYCRNQRCNRFQRIVSAKLRRLGAGQKVFRSLNKLKICTSYYVAINRDSGVDPPPVGPPPILGLETAAEPEKRKRKMKKSPSKSKFGDITTATARKKIRFQDSA